MTLRFAAIAVLFSSCFIVGAADGPSGELVAARDLLLSGKYAEAEEAFAALAEKHPVPAAIGIARTLTSRGKLDDAETALTAALVKHPTAAPLHAELAQHFFDRGDYATSTQHVSAAIALDPRNRLARWVMAETLRVGGRLDEAAAAYESFVDDYNATDKFDDPDDLRLIGLAAAQFARWNRLSDQFNFLVNDLYPSALELDKHYWPAKYETGRLFLEKYNEAEAAKDLKAALALNPNAAEIHTALAQLALQNFNLEPARRSIQRALELRPGYVPALRAKADALLANFAADEAIAVLEEARKLNPVDEETLGKLAASYAVVDGWSDAHEQSVRFKKIVDDVNARNPHAGEFYFALAQAFDQTRRFPAAAKYYREATARMPQLTTSRGELGMMLMRLGDEVEAKKLLDESFDIDPFNVRVSNLRKVLDVLSEYAVLETPHFVIKYDRIQDDLLAQYAADYLEEQVYPELTKKFGFEPEGKSLFEIFNRSRNTDGHGWFSARMVGLPYVGTVGACAGKMVALTSPNSMKEKFNWARVLKHEFVHVLNLQQSRFNIPHWYTEALAVESEGYPRSDVWNKLLAERVPKNDLFNLDTINLGFVRPKSSLDWQMAYCQAQLYAQYMLKTYGDDALAKMLAAYRDNLNTKAALRRCFDVDQADFEQGYLEFVRAIAKDLTAAAGDETTSLAELLKKAKEKPDDADAAAHLARAYLAREEYPKAREQADAALKILPKHQLATLVRVRLRLVIGEDADAEKVLSDCLDKDKPNAEVLALLASLVFQAKRYDEAEMLYALGHEKFPYDPKWAKALAKIYLVTKNQSKLAASLEALALADADDGVVRRKLAQMGADRGDFAESRRWATEALHCDVLDPTAHRLLAAALVELKEPLGAMREYETLVKLEPDDAEVWAGLVRTARAAGKDEIAAKAAERLKQLDPKHTALEESK